MMRIKSNNQIYKSILTILLFAGLFVSNAIICINGEQDSNNNQITNGISGADGSSSGNNGGGGFNPKRQYLIAPRIGRSSQLYSSQQQPAIWKSLEEATINYPTNGQNFQQQQQQQHKGYSGSTLLFLVSGNRRIIGPRSGGLLPQARIGRRSAPVGLMPQPRVGRSINIKDNDNDFDFKKNQLKFMTNSLVDGNDNLIRNDYPGEQQQQQQQELGVVTFSDTNLPFNGE